MQINKQQLKQSIIALTEGQDLEHVLNVILEQLDPQQLIDIAQYLLDPVFKDKQQILCNPQRFIPTGSMVSEMQAIKQKEYEDSLQRAVAAREAAKEAASLETQAVSQSSN